MCNKWTHVIKFLMQFSASSRPEKRPPSLSSIELQPLRSSAKTRNGRAFSKGPPRCALESVIYVCHRVCTVRKKNGKYENCRFPIWASFFLPPKLEWEVVNTQRMQLERSVSTGVEEEDPPKCIFWRNLGWFLRFAIFVSIVGKSFASVRLKIKKKYFYFNNCA